MIQFARFETNQTRENFRKLALQQVQSGSLEKNGADALIEEYTEDLHHYTYLENGES